MFSVKLNNHANFCKKYYLNSEECEDFHFVTTQYGAVHKRCRNFLALFDTSLPNVEILALISLTSNILQNQNLRPPHP